jgi:hypothetical protein
MPASMAFAEVAGLPAVAGLYALLLPTIAYAFVASSKRLMIGPEGATAAMAGAAIAPIAGSPEEAAALASALALLVGAVFLVARLVRLGWLADYFSRPVLVGYIHGVALVLLVGQLGKLTGTSIEADEAIPQLVELAGELDMVSAATAAVGAVVHAVVTRLATRHDAGEALPAAPSWRIDENRWSACRHGPDGEMKDLATGERRPTRDRLHALLDELAPDAERLGCAAELSGARDLLEPGGAAIARAMAAEHGLRGLVARLADAFASDAAQGGSTPGPGG